MADKERRWREQTASDETLARTLAEVGPLMGRQERAEAEEPEPVFAQPDPAFERALRARLTGEEPATSNAAAARPPHAPAEGSTTHQRRAARTEHVRPGPAGEGGASCGPAWLQPRWRWR